MVPDGEDGQDRRSPASSGRCSAGSASPAPTPSSASAGERSPTWPASSPPPGCAASGSCRCPTTLLGMVDAAVGGKTGDQHRRRQEPGRRLPPAGRGARRHRGARRRSPGTTTSRAGRGGQVRLHRRPAASSTCSRPTRPRAATPGRPAHPRAHRAGGAGQGRRRRRGPLRQGGAGVPQLRPHPRPRHRAGRGLRLAARRGRRRRAGLRRRARPARRAGSTTRPSTGTATLLAAMGLPTTYAGDWERLQAVMRVDKKARGRGCASSSSTAWPGRGSSTTPTRPGRRRVRRGARERPAVVDRDRAAR